MTDGQFLIRKALQLSLEGDRLLNESLMVGEELKNKLTIKACGFHERAKRLYYQAQEV